MNKLDPHFQIVEADADTLDLSSMVNMAVENRKMIILIVCTCLLFGTLVIWITECSSAPSSN
jgi:hypothetical protein